jgi:hypothetical protein
MNKNNHKNNTVLIRDNKLNPFRSVILPGEHYLYDLCEVYLRSGSESMGRG